MTVVLVAIGQARNREAWLRARGGRGPRLSAGATPVKTGRLLGMKADSAWWDAAVAPVGAQSRESSHITADATSTKLAAAPHTRPMMASSRSEPVL